jgi:hypothetical protein
VIGAISPLSPNEIFNWRSQWKEESLTQTSQSSHWVLQLEKSSGLKSGRVLSDPLTVLKFSTTHSQLLHMPGNIPLNPDTAVSSLGIATTHQDLPHLTPAVTFYPYL